MEHILDYPGGPIIIPVALANKDAGRVRISRRGDMTMEAGTAVTSSADGGSHPEARNMSNHENGKRQGNRFPPQSLPAETSLSTS